VIGGAGAVGLDLAGLTGGGARHLERARVGIKAGGLFTGAEGIKTADQAAVYGGTAGVAYDPCYHQLCDDISDLNNTALDQMADATAHALLSFGMTTSAVNGTDKGQGRGQYEGVFEFKGPHRVK
jgi:Zn-dependent M28 family amino/carboxypeptidase